LRGPVRKFAEEVAAALPIAEPVVEIGARPAEGQQDIADLRQLFGGKEYIGCDIQEGPGVDRVEDVHALTFADDSVGTLLAMDTLEHVADPLRAVQEMHRVLRPGGVLAMSSVMFFPIHAHPWDYWRFTPEGFALLLTPFESKLVMAQGWEHMPETVFGVGVKGPYDGLVAELLPETNQAARDWGAGMPVDFGPIRMTTRQLWRQTMRASVTSAQRRLSAIKSGRRPAS
jgi:SAM-dependent methyltransferase